MPKGRFICIPSMELGGIPTVHPTRANPTKSTMPDLEDFSGDWRHIDYADRVIFCNNDDDSTWLMKDRWSTDCLPMRMDAPSTPQYEAGIEAKLDKVGQDWLGTAPIPGPIRTFVWGSNGSADSIDSGIHPVYKANYQRVFYREKVLRDLSGYCPEPTESYDEIRDRWMGVKNACANIEATLDAAGLPKLSAQTVISDETHDAAAFRELFNKSIGTVTVTLIDTAALRKTYDNYISIATNTSISKCECGADACKSPMHSSWCPKAES